MIRIESHGFANPMDSQKCESMRIPGFAWIRRILDSQRLGIRKMEILRIHGFARQKNFEGFANPIFWDSQDLAFMRIPGFALMRIHANPHFCQNLILRIRIRMNANPDANPNASHKVRGSKII